MWWNYLFHVLVLSFQLSVSILNQWFVSLWLLALPWWLFTSNWNKLFNILHILESLLCNLPHETIPQIAVLVSFLQCTYKQASWRRWCLVTRATFAATSCENISQINVIWWEFEKFKSWLDSWCGKTFQPYWWRSTLLSGWSRFGG